MPELDTQRWSVVARRACTLAAVVVVLLVVTTPATAVALGESTPSPNVAAGSQSAPVAQVGEQPVTPQAGGNGTANGTGSGFGNGTTNGSALPGAANGTASNGTNQTGGFLSGPLIPPGVKQQAAQQAIGPVLNFSIGYVPVLGVNIASGDTTMSRYPFSDLSGILYWGFSIPVALSLCVTGAFVNAGRMASPFSQNTHRHIKSVIRAVVAAIVGVASHLIIVAWGHRAVRSVALAIGPSPAELTSSSEAVFKFGTMTVFMLGSLYQLGWDLVKYVAIAYGVGWLALVLMALLSPPLFVTWIYFHGTGIADVASSLLWVYGALIMSPIVQAGLIRIAWALEWGASFTGIISAILSLSFLALSIGVQPLMLVVALFSRRRAASTLSMGAASIAGSSIAAGARQRAVEKKQQGVEYGKRRVKDRASSAKERVADRASYAKRSVSRKTKAGAAAAQRRYWDAKGKLPSERDYQKTYSNGADESASKSTETKTSHRRTTAQLDPGRSASRSSEVSDDE